MIHIRDALIRRETIHNGRVRTSRDTFLTGGFSILGCEEQNVPLRISCYERLPVVDLNRESVIEKKRKRERERERRERERERERE